jgi:hypothetical protein
MNTRFSAWSLGCGISAATTLAVPPTIQVTWEEVPGPIEDVHYEIDDTDPDFPDVQLIEESLTWRIWSEDSDNPDGIGDIGVISSPYPENFGVKIEDDLGDPGAREVKGIDLDPQGEGSDLKFSNLTGGRMTGNLTGDLYLQRLNTGEGGDASFTIDGNTEGNMWLDTVLYLCVRGNVIVA